MKPCLQCEEQFDAKRDTAKFCSVNCRVKWNRKNGNKSPIKPLQMQVLYNQLLEVVTKMNTGVDVYKKDTPVFNKPAEIFKKSSWDEPEQGLITFQELLNGMAGIQFSDDKEDYAVKINAATHLSDKQRNLLLTNLWTKQ